MKAQQLWNRILAVLKEEVNPQIFNSWFGNLIPADLDETGLLLEAPHSFIKDWVEENYISTLTKIAQTITGENISVRIQVNEALAPLSEGTQQTPDPTVVEPPPQPAAPAPTAPQVNNHSALNPKYTFDTFVVGSSNQFAHAATLAVAEHPARSYNPLFIYGGVGLGKTHLMHAIGHLAKERDPKVHLCYLSSEQFMNELINSLRFDRMPQFREKFRNMDILLVDDIQFIAGKERTQEEFFHTFNSLFDSHKQIVVSSDKFPREMPDLEERLRSRFEWGLIADIQAPDLETKIAILEKKADISGITLPQGVALFLAENTGSNIRELEGYLQRVTAFAAFAKTKTISMDLVQEALKNLLEQKKKVITVEEIQKNIAAFFSTKVSDMKSKKKNKAFIKPRHTAMFLTRQLTNLSLPEIGRHFGGRDHSTVLHAIQKVDNIAKNNQDFQDTLDRLIKELEGNNHG
ncbi:MAG: chromosomal replication initiator protein DnaA [bacterium]|nr:chromosomal replication initiator protein DnaA [bacterium]MDT8366993.1 chromosomal replication initiator protein DnaA [bacterium]